MTRVMTISLLALLSVVKTFGQSTPNPTFEVAAIKVNRSGGIAPEKERLLPGGRIELSNFTLKEAIAPAYGVKSNLIVGGPKWINSERFDIVAKAAPDTPVPTFLLMVRSLLEERFKLTFHREDKVMQAYALVIGKGGSRLRQSAGGGRQNCTSRLAGTDGGPRAIHRECHNMTMNEFVRQLGLGGYGIDDRPVVNSTQLEGLYDFDFEYSRPAPSGSPDFPGPTIFDGINQLGLRLEVSKQMVPVMIIDHAEEPVE
jgi:uncharacterized protein (TIGR03435 family)